MTEPPNGVDPFGASVISDCWVWCCEQCKIPHSYDAARLTCQIQAGKHARRFPGHHVSSYNLRDLAKTKQTHLYSPLYLGEEPPF